MPFAGMLLVVACLAIAGCAAPNESAVGRRPAVPLNFSSPLAQDPIPAKYANTVFPGGENISPAFAWQKPPYETKSFALAVVDEAPAANHWVHWLVVDIPADTTQIAEGATGDGGLPAGAVELQNTFGESGYGGPQPPAGSGPHHYVATLYSLDVEHLGLPSKANLEEFKRAIAHHVLAQESIAGELGR